MTNTRHSRNFFFRKGVVSAKEWPPETGRRKPVFFSGVQAFPPASFFQ
jgi:hypothetical protein